MIQDEKLLVVCLLIHIFRFTHIENEGDEDVEWSKQDKRFIQMVTACGKLAGLHLIDSRQRNIEVCHLNFV